ncbi:uncharacterized protein [Polyergus mexicanus]|uniref:uncharacterized protein n=1 Tax=Polyergus mexicanus TaxID=615972 RepID=UPI0038B4A371
MGLLRALLNLVVFQRYQYTSDIQIPGFLNFEHQRDVRMLQWHEREFREDMWEDNGSGGVHLDLRRLRARALRGRRRGIVGRASEQEVKELIKEHEALLNSKLMIDVIDVILVRVK